VFPILGARKRLTFGGTTGLSDELASKMHPAARAWGEGKAPRECQLHRPSHRDLEHLRNPSLRSLRFRRLGIGDSPRRRTGLAHRLKTGEEGLPKETNMRSTSNKYEIHSGRRLVSTQFSVSPLQAVVDYVRTYGVKDDEITRLGADSVSWRGARFKAVLVRTESP